MGEQPSRGTQPELIRITLEGVPEESLISVDGRPVPGPSFEVPPSARGLAVAVRAPGFEPWQGVVPAESSSTVSVHMRPERGRTKVGPPTRPGGKGRGDASPQAASGAAVKGTLSEFGKMP